MVGADAGGHGRPIAGVEGDAREPGIARALGLQPDWIPLWLQSPLKIQPGTRMPMFWPDYPKSAFPQMGGSAEMQIRSIRDYLETLRGGPSPKKPAGAETSTN